MRDKIFEKLDEWENETLNLTTDEQKSNKTERIFYGQKNDGIVLNDWNYIVFGQEKIRKTGNNVQDLSCYIFVDIIRENYIDDDTIYSLIEKIEEIPGIKLLKDDMPIDYIKKGNTDIVCELMRLRFTRPFKRINIYG